VTKGGQKKGGRTKKAGRRAKGAQPAALAALAPPAADDRTLPDLTGAHDLTLLERNRMRWLLGDWDALAAIPAADLRGHPQRERLALLVAAAHAQRGDLAAARLFLQLAADWGCDRGLIRRVMVSGLRNTLGRAAMAAGEPDRAAEHFAAAIGLGAPGSEATLLARARMASQTAAPAAASPAAALAADPAPPDPTLTANPRFDARAHAAWSGPEAGDTAGFLYLDVKSLPRSGLHYLRNTLAAILGEAFSFCEWYNEPGCCKRMPCSLTAYRTAAGRHAGDRSLVRMVKSHDFDLDDPAFPAAGAIRRIVLVRDPLYVLTSWFSLQILYWHADLLRSQGVGIGKVNYLHEAPVLATAYGIVDARFTPPDRDRLAGWLRARQAYIAGFVAKWGPADGPRHRVVPYGAVPDLIVDLVGSLAPALAPDARDRFARHAAGRRGGFAPRQDPFAGPCPAITHYLRDASALFLETAEAIRRADPTGLLGAARD
jgi:hypothetical protein